MSVQNPYNSPFEVQFDPGRAQEFMIRQLLGQLHTAQLVRVLAVNPVAASVGTVDVIPVVLEATTGGLVLAQSPIFTVPYLRVQGGTSAVIIDPVIDDFGLCVFAERDITGFIQTLTSGPAPTARTHSSADGLYFGGFLNAAPTQWIKFLANAGGIDIYTPGALSLEGETISLTAGTTASITAPGGLTITANVTLNGTMSGTSTGTGAYQFAGTIEAPDVVVPNGSVNSHVHGGVQYGTSSTGTMTG